MYIDNIQNPVLNNTANSLYIYSYNSLNKIILERSYKNLDPFTFKYEYLGPLITVNGDQGLHNILFILILLIYL